MTEGLMISADQLIDIDLRRLWRVTCDKRLMRVRHIAHMTVHIMNVWNQGGNADIIRP